MGQNVIRSYNLDTQLRNGRWWNYIRQLHRNSHAATTRTLVHVMQCSTKLWQALLVKRSKIKV